VLFHGVKHFNAIIVWIIKPGTETVQNALQLSIRDYIIAVVDLSSVSLQVERDELYLGIVFVFHPLEMPVTM
jgi:hypothetical protein